MRARPWSSPVMSVLLAGCWLTENELDEKLGVGSGETVELLGIGPDYGSSRGGTTVELAVSGQAEDVSVEFDGVEAEIVSIEAGVVVVESPPHDEGWVDISVVVGSRESTLRDVFHYWQDGAGDSGALGEIAWYQYYGDYWDSSSDPSEGFAWLTFMTPEDVRHADLYGVWTDDCASEFEHGIEIERYLIPNDEATLSTTTGVTLGLTYDGEDLVNDGFGSQSWRDDVDWTLEMDGGQGWPALDIEEAVRTPDEMYVWEPYIDQDSLPGVEPDFTLSWDGPYQGDYVVAYFFRYDGNVVDEEVICLLEDDGEFEMPGYVWSAWPEGEILMMYVGRATVGNATLPHNDARIEVAGVSYAVGAAYTTSW